MTTTFALLLLFIRRVLALLHHGPIDQVSLTQRKPGRHWRQTPTMDPQTVTRSLEVSLDTTQDYGVLLETSLILSKSRRQHASRVGVETRVKHTWPHHGHLVGLKVCTRTKVYQLLACQSTMSTTEASCDAASALKHTCTAFNIETIEALSFEPTCPADNKEDDTAL